MSDMITFRSGIMGALQGAGESGWTVLSGRVIDGTVPFTRATGSGLWVSCQKSVSGPLAVVHAAENLGKLRAGLPRFRVMVDVYFAIDAATQDTLSGIVRAVEDIRRSVDDALQGGTVYSSPRWHRAGRVAVAHYQLAATGIGCEAYTRWLRNESDVPVLNESDLVIFV